MKYIKFIPIIVLAIALMACSFTVNVPSVRTGVTQSFDVSEPALAISTPAKLSIEMGAGTLKLSGGASNLVEGTIQYNVEDWKPSVLRSADGIKFSQKNTSNVGIPDGTIVNDWDLKLGTSPIDLNISAGAYDGNLDLSGISITSLTITDGASKAKVFFNSLNPSVMTSLSYKTGASDVELHGLGNANVQEVSFDGGVGAYTLDFSGELKNNISARVSSGMSDLKIIIPSGSRAMITVSGGLSNIDATGTWTISGNSYQCGTNGPTITININMAVGNLQLIQQ
jgi:hypothetical protein